MADQDLPSELEEQGAWARPASARVGEIAVAIALQAVALFFVFQAALLPFGSVGLPGPGFLPFVLGITLGVLALAILYDTMRRPGGGIVFFGHRDVLIVLAALAGVAFAFEQVDTYVTLGVFSAVVLVLVARAAPWKAVLGTVLGMVALWAMFSLALGLRLPTDEFWDALRDLTTSKLEGRL